MSWTQVSRCMLHYVYDHDQLITSLAGVCDGMTYEVCVLLRAGFLSFLASVPRSLDLC